MEKQKLNPQRASDQIEQELIRKIISLELPPGGMISETDLAKMFDCGRTPLREALQRLTATRLVVNIPHRGSFIAELKLMDYIQLTEALSILESGITRQAAEKFKPEDQSALEDILQRAREAGAKGDFLTVALEDFAFHLRISEITQNQYLVDTTMLLHRLICRFNYTALCRGMKFDISLQDHAAILQEMISHNGERAAQLIQDHMANVKDRIMRAL